MPFATVAGHVIDLARISITAAQDTFAESATLPTCPTDKGEVIFSLLMISVEGGVIKFNNQVYQVFDAGVQRLTIVYPRTILPSVVSIDLKGEENGTYSGVFVGSL